jgi:putative transposase
VVVLTKFTGVSIIRKMKQRHSYTNLLFHIVIPTKHREHLIFEREERAIESFMKKKAHDLDAWLEEFGAWNDHVHVLLRMRPTVCLSDVYGQLKGFSAWSLRQRWPDRTFGWSDGVFAETVDPNNCEPLRMYIRNQRIHHEQGSTQHRWEPEESP